MNTVTSPPQIAPNESVSPSRSGYVFNNGFFFSNAACASAITSDSNLPPPIVPVVSPSAYTNIFEPGARGTDPVVAATVTTANGFRPLSPPSVIPRHGRRDISMRFVRRNKHFVLIFQAERRQVDEEAMLVRHREIELRDFRTRGQGRFAH